MSSILKKEVKQFWSLYLIWHFQPPSFSKKRQEKSHAIALPYLTKPGKVHGQEPKMPQASSKDTNKASSVLMLNWTLMKDSIQTVYHYNILMQQRAKCNVIHGAGLPIFKYFKQQCCYLPPKYQLI